MRRKQFRSLVSSPFVVPSPDIIGRDKILKVHTKKIKMDKSVKTIAIARSTPGFSGADLANIVNEAALIAARKNKKIVTMDDFEDAKDKVMLGTQNKSKIISDAEKEVIAYHEAGHALANLHCKHADPIYKSSIIPTGRALGFVMSVPEQDKVIHRKDEYLDKLVVTVAARIAEELIFVQKKLAQGLLEIFNRLQIWQELWLHKWVIVKNLEELGIREIKKKYS